MAYSDQAATTAGPQPNEPARARAADILAGVSQLEDRLERLMDRISAPTPRPVSGVDAKGETAMPPLEVTLSRLTNAVARCHSVAGRLEDRL